MLSNHQITLQSVCCHKCIEFLLLHILTFTWYFRLFNFSNVMGINLVSNFGLFVCPWWVMRDNISSYIYLPFIFLPWIDCSYPLAIFNWVVLFLWFIELTYILYTDSLLVTCSLCLDILLLEMCFFLIFI